MEKLLKPSEVAQILNISASYVYKLADSGLLPAVRFCVSGNGKRKKETLRFYPKDVEIFVKDHYTQT